MRKSALALAALGLLSTFTAITPATAEAHLWHHGWHRGWRGDEWREDHDRGAAIALGVIGGLVAGAAIASSHPYAPPPYHYGGPYGYGGYGYYR